MRLHKIQPKTIKPIKPLTPDQQRVASLQANAKRADEAERARQQQRKAQQALATIQRTMVMTSNS